MGFFDYLIPASWSAKLTSLLLGQGRIESRLEEIEAQLLSTKEAILAEIKDQAKIQQKARPPNEDAGTSSRDSLQALRPPE